MPLRARPTARPSWPAAQSPFDLDQEIATPAAPVLEPAAASDPNDEIGVTTSNAKGGW